MTEHTSVLYLVNVSRGGAKLRFQEITGGGGEPGIQLFSVIYAIVMDIRLDKFPSGGEKKARGGRMPPRSPPSPINAPLYMTHSTYNFASPSMTQTG